MSCSSCGELAMEAPFLPPVSAGLFWCLVFDVCVEPLRELDQVSSAGLPRGRAACRPLYIISPAAAITTPAKNALMQENVGRTSCDTCDTPHLCK